MSYATTTSGLIGNTPLIDLSALASCGGARILGKYEAANPGGSVKDRIALAIIGDAERTGRLAPGGTIIEPTSGNTGVGLAMIAAERGYRMILVMPDTMSIERRKLAAAYGAEIVLTPGSEGMRGAVTRADALADEMPGAIIAGQFTNPANPRAHYATTGPEIWSATDGTVDALVAGVGTGGTISGAGRFLKEQNAEAIIVAVEPAESPVLSGGAPGAHRIQGIGAGFIPATYDAGVVDEIMAVASDDALAAKRRLAREIGLLVGISAGAAVAAAVQLAEGGAYEERTIVAMLPDTGERYLSLEV
ncbi:cysteine synthase A [Coriobacteriales bacterium OH1046]|nr:cysteine synthase A [Coriobacteriales bacterium OH1046]